MGRGEGRDVGVSGLLDYSMRYDLALWQVLVPGIRQDNREDVAAHHAREDASREDASREATNQYGTGLIPNEAQSW